MNGSPINEPIQTQCGTTPNRCLEEMHVPEAAGLVLPYTPLCYLKGQEAANLRLALRLRGGQGGTVIPFERMPHAAGAAGVEG